MFIRFDRIHERDGHTDRHRMTTYAARQKLVCGYPMVKKIEDICIFSSTEYTNVTDGRMDRRTPHDGKGRAYA